jgi:hypothetical protein
MAAGAWIMMNTACQKMLNGTFNIDADTFKMCLLTSASNITVASTTYAGLTGEQSPTSSGYTTGGISVDLQVTLVTTNDAMCDIGTDPVWTASTNGITDKWACIYEVAGDCLCFHLLDSGGADVTATNGNTLTDQTNASGVFQLTT